MKYQDLHHEELDELKIRKALLSVHDKAGIVRLAEKLKSFDISIIATGGTRSQLENVGIETVSLDEIARFPEMLDGRVKTLQPEIFAGILARKSSKSHMMQIDEKKINPIDMVVSNFYAFEKAASRNDSSVDELIEKIDIGGPSLVRAAAKNFESVCVVPSPSFYEEIMNELTARNGSISLDTRRRLSLSAFAIVAHYDVSIYGSLHKRFSPSGSFPQAFFLSARSFEVPNYGENPGQNAMIYSIDGVEGGVSEWRQLFGDVRSYNNYLDITSSYQILQGFESHPAAATVKHGQISGFAFSDYLADAYKLAHSCDPEADFGNTTVLNRIVDEKTARLIGKNGGTDERDESVYTEIVLAPGFEQAALEILKNKQKKKMRIIAVTHPSNYPYDVKLIEGIVLVQVTQDYTKKLDLRKITVETVEKPRKSDSEILLALWELCRRIESNGIVIGNGKLDSSEKLAKFWTLGVATFRKRNGATKIALDNAGGRSSGAYCASDGFFPFPDGVELLGNAGIRGIIQPGGSLNDRKVIEKANEYGMIMLFTHERAFKH